MIQNTISTPTRQSIQDEIALLVQELPYDSLLTLREFGRFLRFQRQQQDNGARTPPPTYAFAPQQIAPDRSGPWRTVPAEEVFELTHVLAEGYEGDALEDTEAIADEV